MPTDAGTVIELGPIRDQGARPTCLSFAVSDVHRSRLEGCPLLSPESLHRAACLRLGSSDDQAIPTTTALTTLDLDGQTCEASWPYGHITCSDAAATYFRRQGREVPFDALIVEQCIASGMPLVAILQIGGEFFRAQGGGLLEVTDILPPQACHAVAISGIRGQNNEQSFLIRNSWGINWGHGGSLWVSKGYLQARSMALLILD